MAEFYDHPVTGKLHFRSIAGAGSGIWDAPATEADVKAYSKEHQLYLVRKRNEAAKADEQSAHDAAASETRAMIAELSAEKAALAQQVQALSDAAAKL